MVCLMNKDKFSLDYVKLMTFLKVRNAVIYGLSNDDIYQWRIDVTDDDVNLKVTTLIVRL
jgi:hypothetical protein